jgi:hypothetical protein
MASWSAEDLDSVLSPSDRYVETIQKDSMECLPAPDRSVGDYVPNPRRYTGKRWAGPVAF